MLSQKETSLLKDMKSQEELCVEKYEKAAQCAHQEELKNLFQQIEGQERKHLQTITQIMDGKVPSQTASGMGQQASFQPQSTAGYSAMDKKEDQYLCSDTLGTEKHVSSVYNTGIFEFKSEAIRNTLNHIQAEEQQHGKMIYDYMSKNGMYEG